MSRIRAGRAAKWNVRQRGAAAVEFALVLPLLLSMLLGVIDFGTALGQSISLQGAARESARQGVTQGDVIASANLAKGMMDNTKLQVKFVVDTSGGTPGVMVVCLRYPQSSLSGFYSWVLNGFFEAKAVMKMEGTAAVTSGSQGWSGGSCTL
ncbi:TadE/TadG family type IV pilus assembly protein [Arthrobacter sp. 2MCAF14]|uniref:TadE/TadG family type IV pilus assembly protein n=1 Tax=Arthrobacter sp. 2MCAF14 TaxID=3232982 RepID=UPI003F938384